MSIAQPTLETAVLPKAARRQVRARSRGHRSWLMQFLFAPFEDTDDRVRVRPARR
jgi:hypothetical protein